MPQSFKSFDELKTFLISARSSDQIPVVELTPELAKQIFEHKPSQREVRKSNVAKLVREIRDGNWDPLKSPAMRFLPTGQMIDGQHRCLAVIESDRAITVPMCVVDDIVGVDEGSNRTLSDHIHIIHNVSREEAPLAAAVTRAICAEFMPSNRTYLKFYVDNEQFITETVRKAQEWLADRDSATNKVFKPVLVAVMRAKAIRRMNESPGFVDDFLVAAINGGVTAPEGSVMRQQAAQFHDAMFNGFNNSNRKKVKQSEIEAWLGRALEDVQKGRVSNITSAARKVVKKRPRKAA